MRNTYSKNVRYLSALMLIVFLIGTMASLSLIPSFALSAEEEVAPLKGIERATFYLDNAFTSKEAKLSTMSKRTAVGDYELYVETTTGEVAVRNIKTGQILTTNPYDAASASAITKQQLMSQLSLSFSNVKTNVPSTFWSFEEAALRGQISVKNIKNGVRVEYTLGKIATKRLVPGRIEYNRFNELIYQPALENCYSETEYQDYMEKNPYSSSTLDDLRKGRVSIYILANYGTIINANDFDVENPSMPGASQTTIEGYRKKYKCCFEEGPDYNGDGQNDLMVIRELNPGASEYVLNTIETQIKAWTNYSYEELQYDTDMTGYEAEATTSPLFRLALEYTLNSDGMEVRLPANSIRFDEDNYRLESINVLPYFGTTSNDYTGYTFIPDGSGTLVRNEEIINDGRNQQFSIYGQIYGPDYAYHNITSQYNGKNQIMHLPVFGTVEDTVTRIANYENQTGYIWLQEQVKDGDNNPVYYGKDDPIMLDAVNSEGELITSVEEYLAQFKYDSTSATPSVIRIGDPLWDSPDYIEVPVGEDPENPLEHYNTYVELGLVPYVKIVYDYLMKPALNEKGEKITYQGSTVYVYVDEDGNEVDIENRVEGILKLQEQLWYNGKPAFYQSNVPIDPTVVIPDAGETPEAGEVPEEGDGEVSDEETSDDTETKEPEVKIEYYNDVPKVTEKYDEPAYEEIETKVSQGYFAIITEGDALCSITSDHGALNPKNPIGGTHKYNSVYITVFPRPKDTYRLADAISVSNDATEWVVVSDRKYTGSYRIQYVMISDASYMEEGSATPKQYKYEASYVGMANAYRDYLLKNGVLTPLENLDDDIPLYLEAFGMTTATKVVATIPMEMDVALTSFDDLKTIYKDLSDDGVDNINFRLTGFNKGGLYSYAPSAMKFESVVGGNDGYEEMVKYSQKISAESDKNFGLFPDFDFANVERVGGLDGFDSLDDSARTIDDRYASKRAYDFTYQTFLPVGSITVSPSVYMRIFKDFAKKIDKLGVAGLSVGSLGTDLNSDFDSDDAYNREDSKYYTVELLKTISEKYGNVMIDGGNAYALPYADHILNMPLNSTRFVRASTAVPFMGMVLHGYVNYAGTATGMASDINTEILRIIENGAAPYFTIAYQNTSVLKNDASYSDYYSIDYEICYDYIVENYKILNEALADVQTATITDHEFLTALRSLSKNEQAEADALMEIAATEEGYTAAKEAAWKAYNGRKALAERHGEEFTEKFEETYPYFVKDYETEADAELYVQYVYDEYVKTLNRELTGNKVVMVEYTRKDGTTKTFILNYETYDVTVTLGGTDYFVESNRFVVAGN